MAQVEMRFGGIGSGGGGGGSKTISIPITSADFGGNDYTNVTIIGKVPMVDFNVYSNDGSGALLKVNDGYTFNAGTGTITMTAGNYVIQIY